MRLHIIQSPLTINASNVDASSLTAWSSATTYAKAAKVKYQESGDIITREYESLQDTNLNHQPVKGGTEWWTDLGAQNRDKMFDGTNNSRTQADSTDDGITFKVTPPTRPQTVALLGLENCTSVCITVFSDSQSTTPLWTTTVSTLQSYNPVGWWDWLFGARSTRRSIVVDIPGLYYQPCIQVEIVGKYSQIAQCLVCDTYYLGETANGAVPSLVSYSTFEADEFGIINYVPRKNTRELSLTVWTETNNFNNVYALLEKYEPNLVLLDGNNDSELGGTDIDAMRVYGKITSLRPGLAYASTPIDIKIQGLN